MVLWETAYLLGLKRTYAITLRIQRRASSALVAPSSVNSFTGALLCNIPYNSKSFKACNTGRSTGNSSLRWL
ncbi:unnamed protein product [Musa banksii]